MSGCAHNLAKRLAILPMFSFMLSRDRARSLLLETFTGFSRLEELLEVPVTWADGVVSSLVISKGKSPNLWEKFLVSHRNLELTFFPGITALKKAGDVEDFQ